MTVGPLGPDRLGAAWALWQRAAPLDAVQPDALADVLWGAGASAVSAEVDGEVVGLAAGALWPVPGETRGQVRAVAVAPEHRRRGTGTALLDEVERRLVAEGAESIRLVEGAPVYLSPGIDVRNDAALAFARAAGSEEIGEAVDLGTDLGAEDWDTGEAESRLAAGGVVVRRATGADADALNRLLSDTWPAWTAEAVCALGQSPPPLWLALRDGAVLGFAAHSVTPAARGRFGPMGTDPAARGLGIGGVLLRRCLADLAGAHDRAVIGWAAALPFYARACGATVARRYRRFERSPSSASRSSRS